jgi:hypothetical protein
MRLLLLLLLSVAPLYGGGSVYSRFGIGDLTYFGGSRLYALGNTGLALYGDGFINRLNPAGLARISETRFSGGFEYLHYSSSDNRSSGKLARGDFQGLAFAIPIERDYGITLLLESTPYSTVHYAVDRTDHLGETTIRQRLYGSGGLTSLGVGGSFALSRHAFAGAKFNYLFGGIRQLNRIDFDDPTYTNSELQHQRYHSGYNVTLGVNVHDFSDLFGAAAWQSLALGVFLTTPATLNVREEVFHTIGNNTDTLRIASGDRSIPLAWGIGLSYLFSERYIMATDLQVQHWKAANFSEQQSVEIRNSLRLSVGLETLPQRTSDSYFHRVAYRVGMVYNSTYIKVGTTPIDEFLVTGGLGLPIGPNSKLNLGLQFGTRGTTTVQRDTILRLSLSLSASEAWFIRFEED